MPKRGQPPAPETVARLRALLALKHSADADAEDAADALGLETLAAVESGVSRRQIALAVGVVEGTVRRWVARGRQARQHVPRHPRT